MSTAARIEELQKKFDENPRRYFAPLANECRKAGDLDAAIAICRAHLPQQPGHMSGHIVYGQALFEAGELDEARTVFETALGLDPENLIALRHLGDISARVGDLEGARRWYSRVLETDPRNEEIQALLGGLPGGAPVPAPVPDQVEPPAETSAPEAERELPTLMDPELVAAAADAVPETDFLDFEPTSFAPAGPVDEPLRPRVVEASPDLPPVEAPPAPSLTLDGLETTSFEPPPRDMALPDIGLEREDEGGLGAPAVPPLELDTTGFGATGLEPTGLSIPAHAEPESVEMPVGAAPADPIAPDAFVTETMAELYLQQGYRDRALDVYRQLVDQNPGDAGLRERMERLQRMAPAAAADTFAREQVPVADDSLLDADFDAIEPIEPTSPGLPVALEPALVAAAAGATQRPATGPTIREYLAALATGQVAAAVDDGSGSPDDLPMYFPDTDPLVVDAAVGGEVAEVIDVAEAVPPSRGLDALFGTVRSDADLRAAEELASAFVPAPPAPEATAAGEPNPLSGRPARPAGTDLSLDHVFGAQRGAGAARPTGSFSFDQFFSEGAVRAPRDDASEPTPETGSDEDLEQFNAWLKGLKKQ